VAAVFETVALDPPRRKRQSGIKPVIKQRAGLNGGLFVGIKVDTTMRLNIKDPEAHKQAQAIARVTGESMTRAVTEALRERYARIEQRRTKATVEELLAIADRASSHVKRPYLNHAELLYDKNGLPK